MPTDRRYTPGDWPDGLRCTDCMREFVEGQPIAERLFAMDEYAFEAVACVDLICIECSVSGPPPSKYRATGRIEPIYDADLNLLDDEEQTP